MPIDYSGGSNAKHNQILNGSKLLGCCQVLWKLFLLFLKFILDWIRQHPECTFNCFNSPHLRPAFLLDRVFFYFSVDVDLGLWVEDGIPKGEIGARSKHRIDNTILN